MFQITNLGVFYGLEIFNNESCLFLFFNQEDKSQKSVRTLFEISEELDFESIKYSLPPNYSMMEAFGKFKE